MILYHTSYTIVEKPDISFSRPNLDFGKGFYLTPLREQAVKYAERFLRRGRRAYLNVYRLSDNIEMYRHKTFMKYDEAWLRYVGACRKNMPVEEFDIVSGGIANDKVFNTIDLYFAGKMNQEDALSRLRYEMPNKQVCILNQQLMNDCLFFTEAIEIKDYMLLNDEG